VCVPARGRRTGWHQSPLTSCVPPPHDTQRGGTAARRPTGRVTPGGSGARSGACVPLHAERQCQRSGTLGDAVLFHVTPTGDPAQPPLFQIYSESSPYREEWLVDREQDQLL
jgi:hypothetical protein